MLADVGNSSAFSRAAYMSYQTGIYSIFCGREDDVNIVLNNVRNAVVIGDADSKMTYTGDNVKQYVDI